MTTEMITVKLDDGFLKQIDKVVETEGYQNRTEFIRNALREKLEEAKYNAAVLYYQKLRGNSKKQTTDEEIEKMKEEGFKNWSKKSYEERKKIFDKYDF